MKNRKNKQEFIVLLIILLIIIIIFLVVLIAKQGLYINIPIIQNIEEVCVEQIPFEGDYEIMEGDSITFNISANKNGKIKLDFVRIKNNVVNINWVIC